MKIQQNILNMQSNTYICNKYLINNCMFKEIIECLKEIKCLNKQML